MNTERPDPAILFLERILALAERSPDRVKPTSAAPNYEELKTADALSRFHDRMVAAERAGAVELRRGKRDRRHLIDRVVVKDATVLAAHLGRTPASVSGRRARDTLLSVAASGEPWVVSVLDDLAARWSRAQPVLRFAPGSIEPAREFFTLLAAISKDQARGLDGRTFSLKVTNDTKAFDRHASRIATVLIRQFGDPALNAEAVWARIGLERFAHPVHVSGCVVVEDRAGILIDGRAKPFVSIHPELFSMLRLKGQPRALLTIENYASFNRQVREVDDGALVVYTGGFASAGVVDLLTRLLNTLDPEVSFFHWGDIDPGGLRIFRFLEETLPRAPRPHLMERSLAEAHGRSAVCDPALGSMAASDSALAGLAQWLARGESVMHLEQEALDPCSSLGVAQNEESGVVNPEIQHGAPSPTRAA